MPQVTRDLACLFPLQSLLAWYEVLKFLVPDHVFLSLELILLKFVVVNHVLLESDFGSDWGTPKTF